MFSPTASPFTGLRSAAKVLVMLFAVASAMSGLPAFAAEPIVVNVDHAKVMRINADAHTVVIGNPLIADVAMPENKLLVITGKSFGETNILMIDKDGTIIAEYPVVVASAQRSLVTVYRQGLRSTVSCAPICEQHLKVGDRKDYFDDVAATVTARNALSKEYATPTGE